MSSMQSKHVDLENRLSEEHKLRKSAERKIKSLQEKLDYANQERFGDRRQKIQSKAKTSDSDRRKEKDDYDGTDDTLRTDSVGHVPSQELKEPSGKDRDLSNRPDGYKTMGAAERFLPTKSGLPCGTYCAARRRKGGPFVGTRENKTAPPSECPKGGCGSIRAA